MLPRGNVIVKSFSGTNYEHISARLNIAPSEEPPMTLLIVRDGKE